MFGYLGKRIPTEDLNTPGYLFPLHTFTLNEGMNQFTVGQDGALQVSWKPPTGSTMLMETPVDLSSSVTV